MGWKGNDMSNPTRMLNFKNDYFEVIEYHGKDEKWKSHSWKCRCHCGKIVILRTGVLTSGATKSCGCGRKNPFVKGHPYGKRFQPTHGLSKHPLFRVWSHVIDRCYNLVPAHISYRYYQGKGIKVADEWKNDFKLFYDWALENGWQKGLSIDRIDSNGNYEPGNCQFITISENSKKMSLDNPTHSAYNGNSVLNHEQVDEIRNCLARGEDGASIGRKFKIHRKTVYNIRDGKSWIR